MGDYEAQISIYVTEERKREIKQRAKEEDTTMSELIKDLIDQYLQEKAQDAISSEVRAEERIQDLIAVGTESMMETAEEIRRMNATIGAHAIANFELQRRNWSNHVQKEALKTGGRHVYRDFDDHIQELEETTQSTETEPEATTTSDSDQHQSHSETPSSSDTGSQKSIVENDESKEGTDRSDDAISGSDLFEQLRSDQE